MSSNIVDLCREHGVTIKELTTQSGLSHERITAIVPGRWTPSPAERTLVAAVFGMESHTIAWGHTTPIQHLNGHGPG